MKVLGEEMEHCTLGTGARLYCGEECMKVM
jgi:hypothetical protein